VCVDGGDEVYPPLGVFGLDLAGDRLDCPTVADEKGGNGGKDGGLEGKPRAESVTLTGTDLSSGGLSTEDQAGAKTLKTGYKPRSKTTGSKTGPERAESKTGFKVTGSMTGSGGTGGRGSKTGSKTTGFNTESNTGPSEPTGLRVGITYPYHRADQQDQRRKFGDPRRDPKLRGPRRDLRRQDPERDPNWRDPGQDPKQGDLGRDPRGQDSRRNPNWRRDLRWDPKRDRSRSQRGSGLGIWIDSRIGAQGGAP
jgi:hypothetical protein